MWHGENALASFMFDALDDNVRGEALDKNSVWNVQTCLKMHMPLKRKV
jgi:hypothetical protein